MPSQHDKQLNWGKEVIPTTGSENDQLDILGEDCEVIDLADYEVEEGENFHFAGILID